MWDDPNGVKFFFIGLAVLSLMFLVLLPLVPSG
jgi:hypothetical protein